VKKFSSLNEDITSVYNYVVIREENFDEYYLLLNQFHLIIGEQQDLILQM